MIEYTNFMAIIIKILLSLSAITIWLYTQKKLGQRKVHHAEKITDLIHNALEKQSQKIRESVRATNCLLISSSLFIDFLGLFIIYQSFAGDSIRPLLSLMLIFTLRQINQAITLLPKPENMVWKDPGFPSLFVTYNVSNDLFFSGHTAIAVLGALELASLGQPLFTFFGVAIVIYEIIAVLLLRAHWTMDIFTGAIVSLWVHEIMTRIAPIVDRYLTQF